MIQQYWMVGMLHQEVNKELVNNTLSVSFEDILEMTEKKKAIIKKSICLKPWSHGYLM